ncbi:Ferredoxin--NADP reductase [Roseimaritima multifibrata]|uniref:ferredoxin--NADP(+) reductase n=1 Tax=Roseimaritima multifibrata TaxID=1930274 RepID=A0A517M8W5_9BACT|nr:ferredoxin--NADP reductase [Roseimaritima multifibrata]QDS91325.1 Ferredoxin--NADP reductase [Roseimaritima multifibrata]
MPQPLQESPPDATEQVQLRAQHYNAEVIERIDCHENLARFRIRCDTPHAPFQPGQYVALGMGYWESRIQPSQSETVPPKRLRKLVRRAYSISCPMLDQQGNLAACDDVDYLEFYITLVREAGTADGKPPALTPRLFQLHAGDRLCVESKIVGHYVLGGVQPDDTLLLIATGTGEAPHNAMAARLLRDGHRGKIIMATTGRYLGDFAYREIHQKLMQQYPNFLSLNFTTREPANIDPDHPHYVGKQYIQDLYQSGELATICQTELTPATTHVFLCGNPAMIGYTPPGAPPLKAPGMLQILQDAGFVHNDEPAGVGHIRFEKYW